MANRDGAHPQLLRLFADILDYPSPGVAEKALQCEAVVSATVPEAAAFVRAFRTFAEATPLAHLEEVYTGFFDLNPVCYPYVGYHLFGESYGRSTFLLALRERYRAQGFALGEAELADRLSVVLRFAAARWGEPESSELIAEGALPALTRMGGRKEAEKDPAASSGAPAGRSAPQLDGHSEGEVLAGGFLLEMVEGASAAGKGRHAYQSALEAARLVLEAVCPRRAAEPTASQVSGIGSRVSGVGPTGHGAAEDGRPSWASVRQLPGDVLAPGATRGDEQAASLSSGSEER